MGNKIEYRCGLIDFQVGRDHGHLDFSPAEYIKSCARSKMKRVMFTCKDAYGDAYYKSDLIELNPMAGSDYLKAAIDEARNQDIELYAYYNVLLDDIYADMFPEHRMVEQSGETGLSYDYYKALCPNSPYIDVLRERLCELVYNYDVDGIFFDISYFGSKNCFCSHCKSKFNEIFGYKLSNNLKPGTREFADFNEFKRISRSEFLISITDTVKEIKSIPVIWNGSGSFYLAEPKTDEYSEYFTTEFHAPDYLDGIIRAKWMQSRNRGFIMSTPSELGSWGDWTMVPAETFRSVVCNITAHGGGVFFNHTPYPSGDFAKSYIQCIEQNIGSSFAYISQYEERLREAKSCADAAILMSINSKRFCENGFAGYTAMDFVSSLKGVVKMMLESGAAFDVVDESSLLLNIQNYKTIIIPAAPNLGSETAEKLIEFAKSGGTLVTCSDINYYEEFGDINKLNPLNSFLGIEPEGYSEMSVEYLADIDCEVSKGLPDMPILIKNAGKLLNVKKTGGSAQLADKILPPFEATTKRHVYHQHAHPYERTEYSSIVKNKGTIYFSADIFRSFYNTASPWLKRIFLNILHTVNDNPILRINAPLGVYHTLLNCKGALLLQIISCNGSIWEAGKVFPEEFLPNPEIIIDTGLNVKKVYSALDESEIEFIKKGERFEITLRNTQVHTALIIETGGFQ